MPDVFFTSRSKQLGEHSLRYRVPTIYQYHPFAAAGGLISYSSDENEYYRLVGVYAGRILKGDKPADLPIQRSTEVQLIVNLKTARTLGITVPLDLSSAPMKLSNRRCPLLAQSGHTELHCTCPLSGEKRTSESANERAVHRAFRKDR